MCTVPILSRFCRESYNEPLAVYEALKQRGMDLVTVTDHDSIDAAEHLRKYSDFFLSEEVSCVTPSGTKLHVGVYDIEERDHIELQKRRRDFLSLIAYLRERRLFFGINHVFSSLTGQRNDSDFALFENYFPAIETLNGQMLPSCNHRAAAMAARLGRATVGGSDSHTLAPLGLAYTEVTGAHSRPAFFEGLWQARGCVQGRSGDFWSLTRTVCEVGLAMMADNAWALFTLPLMFAVPAVTAAHCVRELIFARKWGRRYGVLPRSFRPDERVCISEVAP